MLQLTRKLIKELAKEEEIPFLMDLRDLIPEIIDEYLGALFEKQMQLNPHLKKYLISRDERNIVLTNQDQKNHKFKFAVLYGEDNDSPIFGIIGPWNKRTNSIAIETLYNTLVFDKKYVEEWSDDVSNNIWVYKPFSKNKEQIFTSIRNGIDPLMLINQLISEFLLEIEGVISLIEAFQE